MYESEFRSMRFPERSIHRHNFQNVAFGAETRQVSKRKRGELSLVTLKYTVHFRRILLNVGSSEFNCVELVACVTPLSPFYLCKWFGHVAPRRSRSQPQIIRVTANLQPGCEVTTSTPFSLSEMELRSENKNLWIPILVVSFLSSLPSPYYLPVPILSFLVLEKPVFSDLCFPKCLKFFSFCFPTDLFSA